MRTDSNRALLTRQLKELKASREMVEGTTYILLLIGSLLAGCVIFSALMNSPLGHRINELRDARIAVALLLMVSCPVLLSTAVLSTVPRWLRRVKEGQAALIEAGLKRGNLAAVVIDEALWEPVYALMRDEPWLHWTGTRRPNSLAQQIEQSADYWRTSLLLADGEMGRLPGAVRLGSRDCRIDNIMSVVFNRWMLILWLGFGSMFLFALLPLLMPALAAFQRQRATHITLLEYFLEDAQAGKA